MIKGPNAISIESATTQLASMKRAPLLDTVGCETGFGTEVLVGFKSSRPTLIVFVSDMGHVCD